MEPIKVAIVEDNALLRDALSQLINGTHGFKCVGIFPDATDIVHHIRRVEPDVILMDIDLPSKMDGVEATYRIKAQMPEVLVIIQTVFDDKTKIFQAIKAGASGYLLKTTPPVKLLQAIQDVMAGGAPMSPSIAFKALELFRQATIETPVDLPSVAELSDRQKVILERIVKGNSYKLIAEDLFITVDTVKFHVKKIYDILQIHSRHELTARFK
jgi:DNA-binding NarL/FixJ family response regulator